MGRLRSVTWRGLDLSLTKALPAASLGPYIIHKFILSEVRRDEKFRHAENLDFGSVPSFRGGDQNASKPSKR